VETWTLNHQAKNNLATGQTNYEKKYVKHHTTGQNNTHLGTGKDKCHGRD